MRRIFKLRTGPWPDHGPILPLLLSKSTITDARSFEACTDGDPCIHAAGMQPGMQMHNICRAHACVTSATRLGASHFYTLSIGL